MYGRVHSLYTAEGGRAQSVHVYAAGTWQNTAGYAARTRPCTYPIHDRARAVYRLHGPCTVMYRPCTVYTAVYTAVFTARVHGGVRTMYTAVHGP